MQYLPHAINVCHVILRMSIVYPWEWNYAKLHAVGIRVQYMSGPEEGILNW